MPSEEEEVLPPLDLPAELAPLKMDNKLELVTNSYAINIQKTNIFCYEVIVTKVIGLNIDKESSTGSKDRRLQGDCTAILMIALDRLGLSNSPYIYNGARSLYLLHELRSERVVIESDELSKDLHRAHFLKGPGRFVVELSPNPRRSKLTTDDVFKELLDSMESGDKSVTSMLQIAMAQEAKKKGFMIVGGGSQMYQPNANNEKKGVEEREGVGVNIKLAAGAKGTGEAQVVVNYKNTRFFSEGPLSDLPLNFQDGPESSKFLRGLRLGTDYSRQIFPFESLSNKPIGEMTAGDGQPLVAKCAEIAGKSIRDFNPELLAIGKSFKNENGRITFHHAIENMRIPGGQKLGPHHGGQPRSAPPNVRFAQTKIVGESAQILAPNPTLKAFGAQVNPEPIRVSAFQLPIPVVIYGNGMEAKPQLEEKGSWNCLKYRLAYPAGVGKVILAYHGSTENPGAMEVVEAMKKKLAVQAQDFGMKIGEWVVEDLAQSCQNEDNVEALVEKITNIGAMDAAERPYLMYLDSPTRPTHDVLKLNERLFEVLTQQGNFENAASMEPEIHTINNLLLKMNAKLGGLNHQVKPSSLIAHLWGPKSETLIISYDVCHSSGGEWTDEPSVVGFAYNTHSNPEIITGDFHLQTSRQERVNDEILTARAQKIIESYFTSRKQIPKNIIILRDGVSEGQYRMVKHQEVVAIEQGIHKFLTSKNEKKKPSMAVVVATKRHSNRLFLENNGRIENTPPLLAIDHTIVRQQANEVIFVSHCPLSGTAQPLLLNVLRNDGVFKSNEELVNLMATLCTAHQNSTNIISLPETIYAADEYAKRGADLFAAYKKYMTSQNKPLPSLENSIDFEKITGILSYGTSIFHGRRMV